MAQPAELNVSVLSPAKVVAKVKATQVHAPGVDGDLGILPGHTKFITELGIGELTLDGILDGTEDGNQTYFIAGGYLEVTNDNVTVLVDVVERPSDIDKARAEKARQRALERLKLDQKAAEVDLERAQAALMRANQRIAIASVTSRH